jgi:hypothetical protein
MEDTDMKDRRTKERRNLKAEAAHVARVRKGRAFNADQRRLPDRRLNNIRVEFISIDDFYQASSNRLYHT